MQFTNLKQLAPSYPAVSILQTIFTSQHIPNKFNNTQCKTNRDRKKEIQIDKDRNNQRKQKKKQEKKEDIKEKIKNERKKNRKK